MRVVYIAPYSPWGPDFGGRMRVRMLWQILSERHPSELIVVGDEADLEGELAGRAAGFFPAASETSVRRARRIGRALVRRRSIPAARYLWPRRERRIVARVKALAPDVVVLGDTYLAELAAGLRSRLGNVRIVADTMNVESELHAGVAAASRSLSARLAYLALAANTRALERRSLAVADQVWAASDENAHTYRKKFRLRDVAVITNAVAVVEPAGGEEKDIVLFIGHFAYPPNAQAAQCLLETSRELDRLGVAHRLWLVGRDPGADLQQAVAATPRASLFANVPDVAPYLARASIFAAPFVSGSGTKLKIAEALMSAKPVVTSTHGVQGLAMTAGRHFMLSSADGFVQALTSLLGDESLRRRLGRAGREWALSNLTYEKVAGDVAEALSRLTPR